MSRLFQIDKSIGDDRVLTFEIEKNNNGVTFAVSQKGPGSFADGQEIVISYDEMREVARFLGYSQSRFLTNHSSGIANPGS